MFKRILVPLDGSGFAERALPIRNVIPFLVLLTTARDTMGKD